MQIYLIDNNTFTIDNSCDILFTLLMSLTLQSYIGTRVTISISYLASQIKPLAKAGGFLSCAKNGYLRKYQPNIKNL
jgi:hypothetical protein